MFLFYFYDLLGSECSAVYTMSQKRLKFIYELQRKVTTPCPEKNGPPKHVQITI